MLVSVITAEEVGSTFLDWTLHFLSGNKKYWNFKESKWSDLVEDPLIYGTAHNHKLNHINGLGEHLDFLKTNFKIYDSSKELYSARINYRPSMGTLKSFIFSEDDEKLFFHKKILVYSKKKREYVHFLSRKEIADNKISFEDRLKRNILLKEKIIKYFPNEQNLKKKINNNGDMRQFLCLAVIPNILKTDYGVLMNFLIKTKNLLSIDFGDMIIDPAETVKKIFQFLQLPLEEKRLVHWRKIHNAWKKTLLPVFFFDLDLDKICHHIINGIPLDLEQYNLDLFQEAQIVDRLRKVHKIKLRVGSLDFFPYCASELTKFCSKKTIDL